MKSCSVTRTVLTTWDEPGRAALEVLPVLMTPDGAKNLTPRSDGDPPPEAGGKRFEVTNTPEDASLFRELEDDVLVPMHFEFWAHFAEKRNALAAVLGKDVLEDR
ncbi:hypothetical protein MYCTH_91906 [Thermothelomyces thermophilus ATCC 42464]|uniref:Uncharacterized protein n=1 Tax=Thermothelomyces thermophilus (strain ATCC 42464 / BCRC 31852 / DSM 1799) TaxID=573729 RepID=G2Q485_THET4|nr:uncharacterized protein MYCTH_91906 [Thermothelomyces thermophilus ATCC 42464]AEO54480.1 hypothetical protein MYCTH_91906 [Thermothelomyces thermophilus ATCC 42464]